MKKIYFVFILLFVAVVIFSAYLVSQRSSTGPAPSAQPFSSKKECEQRTKVPCDFQMCDYIPPGKTLEEVCGKDFDEGWVASPLRARYLEGLAIGDEADVEGYVIHKNSEPLFVDGDGELTVRTYYGREFTILIPARETLCAAQGTLDVFNQVRVGDEIEAFAEVVDMNELRVCHSESHFLKIM